jgi:hypothetical protein
VIEVGVRVEGLARLRRDLDTLGRGGLIGDAMREVEDVVTDAASVLAPVRTGRMRNRTRGSSSKYRATVRAAVVYAPPIHWGWPSRGIEAQPWLSQAAEATEPLWSGIVQEAVQDALDAVRGA